MLETSDPMKPSPSACTSSMTAATLLGAIILGAALQRTNGTLEPTAIFMLIATMVLGLAATLRLSFLPPLPPRVFSLIALGGVAWFIAIHITTLPGVYLRAPNFAVHHQWIAAAAVLSAVALQDKPITGRLTVPLLIVVYLGLGLWLLEASPSPIIDVFVWHDRAYQALQAGHDPYAITLPNIYGHTMWYAPGVADSSTVFVGYVYPPMTLALGWLGHLFRHDYRYANLVMMAATGAIIALARPGVLGRAGAILFLFTPRMFFVLEQGWTEASALFMFSLVVLCALRFPRALPWVFGLALATKQYLVLMAPLGPFLVQGPRTPRVMLGFFARAALAGLVVTAPLALWDLKAFLHSVVLFQGVQPFRADSLSLMAWTAVDGVPRIPMWFSFPAALAVSVLAWWRSARNVASFALASALSFLMFFGVAKQAFCNYYFLVVGVLCVALPLLTLGSSEPAASSASTAGTETPTAPS